MAIILVDIEATNINKIAITVKKLLSIFPIISVGLVSNCPTSNDCLAMTISAPKTINTDENEKIIKFKIK